jgi:hypothetical protein
VIAGILQRLLARWRSEVKAPQAPAADSEAETIILSGPRAPEAPAETLILSPGAPPQASASSDPSTGQEETLIIPAGNRFNPSTPDPQSLDKELVQETVILSPGKPAATSLPVDSINSDAGAEDLPETVVLTPKRRADGHTDFPARPNLDDNSSDLLRPPGGSNRQAPNGAEKKEDPAADEDILTETVILRPEKDKGSQNE